METLVSAADPRHDHYHDASEHGLAWATLNELLHVIVCIYTLLGVIQFRIKFIRMVKLIRWVSRLLVAHSFYLSLKYGLLAALMYLYTRKLEKGNLMDGSSHCSFAASFQLLMSQPARGNTSQSERFESLMDLPQFLYNYDYLPLLANILHQYGGPFKLLGDRMTLVYGFWAVAIYIMLAIFPLELMYFVEVDYNFIRFVLSDPACMADFYQKRREHLRRLSSWSRNQASSMLTEGAKMTLNQRDLRSNYSQDSSQLAAYLLARRASGHLNHCKGPACDPRLEPICLWSNNATIAAAAANSSWRLHNKHYRLSKIASVERKLSTNIHQLRSRLAINHQDRPSYSVRIANKNLRHFKPFVRSHVWFKASMVIYPIYIFLYFWTICILLSLIHYYLEISLPKVTSGCQQQARPKAPNATHANLSTPNTETAPLADWSSWDWLTYCENFYIVFLLSCATSFYCPYYFGTILELSIWAKEICQQLELCAHVNELNYVLTHPGEFHSAHLQRLSRRLLANEFAKQGRAHSLASLDHLVNQFGGFSELWPETRERLEEVWLSLKQLAATLLPLPLRLAPPPHSKQLAGKPQRAYRSQGRAKLRELMAIKLLDKKETLMRATYLNMCLFFDELDDTRFMTTTILRRTIQITCGFAFLVSLTNSAFGPNSWHYTYLLVITFISYNLYLACAAHINSGVKRMLVHVHSLISASLKSDGQDADLFEFWLRHVDSFGEDEDLKAYNIYGYAVTWSNLVNIDSMIFGAYFFNDSRT